MKRVYNQCKSDLGAMFLGFSFVVGRRDAAVDGGAACGGRLLYYIKGGAACLFCRAKSLTLHNGYAIGLPFALEIEARTL